MTNAGCEVRLVLRAQCGDREALEELLRTIHSSLLGYITRLVGRSNADDVLQDVFLQICRTVKWLREPGAAGRDFSSQSSSTTSHWKRGTLALLGRKAFTLHRSYRATSATAKLIAMSGITGIMSYRINAEGARR